MSDGKADPWIEGWLCGLIGEHLWGSVFDEHRRKVGDICRRCGKFVHISKLRGDEFKAGNDAG